MSLTELVVVAGLALLVTPLAVSYIPKDRQSRGFDAVLWIATPLMGLLGALYVLGNLPDGTGIQAIDDFLIAEVPVIPALLGAAAGAFLLNISLWVIDRFARFRGSEREEAEGDDWDDEAEAETPVSPDGGQEPAPERSDPPPESSPFEASSGAEHAEADPASPVESTHEASLEEASRPEPPGDAGS